MFIIQKRYFEEGKMKIKKIKMGIALGMMLALTTAFSGTALAANSANYSVNYVKGAPTSSANPVDYASVIYYAGGYKATSPTFNVDSKASAKVTITSSDAGGCTSSITSATRTAYWKMKGSTSGSVKFKLVASASNYCFAAGVIGINS